MGAARQQETGIGWRQRIHILGRIEDIEHRHFIQALGQRQLDKNSVYGLVRIQFPHLGQQGFLAGIGGQRDMHGFEPQRLGGLALVADIDFGSRIVSHQHRGQARHQAMRGFQAGSFSGDFLAQLGGAGLAINESAGHGLDGTAERQILNRVLQEPDDHEDDDGRQIEPGNGRDHPADLAEHRLGQGVEDAQHGADEIVMAIDDVEGHQPADNHRRDHHPFVDFQDFDQQGGDGVQHGKLVASQPYPPQARLDLGGRSS